MEVSDVRKRVKAAILRATRAAADRRARVDEAAAEYQVFLDRVAIPLFKQIGNVLRAEKHPFSVATPGAAVRLSSDHSRDDYIEVALDTTGSKPEVVVHAVRRRGGRVHESEVTVGGSGRVQDLTEEELLAAVLDQLEPLVER